MGIIKSTATKVSVVPSTGSGDINWMYFKGNGHTSQRNGEWDRINLQRYFYIPILESGKDTLPWLGGFSLTWQLIPVRQAAYYTTFFYSASQNTDFYDLRDNNGYIGCHPYPISSAGEPNGELHTIHRWEFSIDGGDHLSSLVGYGQKFTQAFRMRVDDLGTGQSALRFHTQITGGNTPTSQYFDYTHWGSYARLAPHPYKAMVFGNCPWWRDHQHERLSGFVRRIKIFSGSLSDADLLAESLSDQLVTTAGKNLLWWAKTNPSSPDDLLSDFADKNGKRRQGYWIDSARCTIVRDQDLANHTALQKATLPPEQNPTHLERG